MAFKLGFDVLRCSDNQISSLPMTQLDLLLLPGCIQILVFSSRQRFDMCTSVYFCLLNHTEVL